MLVAIADGDDGDRLIGVIRLTCDPDCMQAEFSIVVGDLWQGEGVGETLLEQAIEIVRERGIESVWGASMPQNTKMQELARKFGFAINKEPESSGYKLTLSLQ